MTTDDDGTNDDRYAPADPGEVGPEHVQRAFELTHLKIALETAERFNRPLLAVLLRRFIAHVQAAPLPTPDELRQLDGSTETFAKDTIGAIKSLRGRSAPRGRRSGG